MGQLGLDTARLSDWMRVRVVGSVGVALFLWLGMGMLPVGLLAGAATYAAIPALVEHQIARGRTLIRDQLVTAARALAGQVRGRATLIQGFRVVAGQLPNPLGRLLQVCIRQFDAGVPIDAALKTLKDRVRLEAMSLFAITLSTGSKRKQGESLADLLDKIAHSLSEDQRVERKRETDTAAGQLVMALLAGFPAAFLGLFYLINPQDTRLVFVTLPGQVVLCIVGGVTWFSLWLARRIYARVV
jgi:tight adherence protein B